MSALRTPRSSGKVRAGAPDRPRRARRAVAAVPVGRRRHALARPAGQRPADRRVQPVPPAARRLPPERPDVRLRGGRPDRRARPRRARGGPRRVDDRGARRGRAWPTPATSATGSSSSSCARARSAAPRASTSPAPTPTATSSCSCRPGFMRYGEEQVLFRASRPGPARSRGPTSAPPAAASARRPRSTRCRWPGCTRAATPAPVARLEAIRLADWERQGTHWRVPRSSLDPDPALRRRRGLRPGVAAAAARTGRSSTASSRSASPRRTSRTT